MGRAILLLGALTAMATPPHAPPALDEEGPVEVLLLLSPVVAAPEAPPRLSVTVRNVSGKPLKFMRFDSAACFARYYLALSLKTPKGETVAPGASCPVRSWPGVTGELAAGGREKKELKLSELFPQLPWNSGPYWIDASWAPEALAGQADASFSHAARSTSINQTSFRIAKVLAQVHLEKGKTASLPDGAQLTFTAHSHKRTMVGGPESPLIVYGKFAAPGAKAAAEFQRNLFPDDNRIFAIDGHQFELVAHEYDTSMELRYFGKLAE